MNEGTAIEGSEAAKGKVQTAETHPHGKRYHLVWRSAGLTVMLMMWYVWWNHNFGEGLTGVPAIATVAAAFSFAMEALDESSKNSVKKWLAQSLLSLIILVPGFLAVAVLLGSLAPVIVVTQGSDSLRVELSPAVAAVRSKDVVAAEKDKPARFRIWTTPLGRAFILKVQGYAPKAVEVAAPIGLTISPDRDLIPQVSLLLRPTGDGMVELLSGGTLQVYRDEGGKEVEIANDQPRTRSSFLLGATTIPLPHDLVEDWRLELAGQQMSDIARANQLRSWKSPKFVKMLAAAGELTAHQKLRVVVRAAGNEDRNCGTIELPEGSGVIADLALHACGEQ